MSTVEGFGRPSIDSRNGLVVDSVLLIRGLDDTYMSSEICFFGGPIMTPSTG